MCKTNMNIARLFVLIVFTVSLTGFVFSHKNLFYQFQYKKNFIEAAKENWLGDGAILGYLLNNIYGGNKNIKVYYPNFDKNISLDKVPFRYINFKDKPFYYFYPGVFIEKNYDYNIKEKDYQNLKKNDHAQVAGRYQKFFVIYPTKKTSKIEFYMFKYQKASIIVPKGLIF